MTVRILHTADLHLDSPLASPALRDSGLREQVGAASRLALERMVDFCIAQDVAAMLIAGDLYDRAERSMKTAAFLAAQMERLNAKGIRVFYVKGNHDAQNPDAGEMPLPANVHVFGPDGEKVQLGSTGIWIHGVSFREARAPQSLLPLFPAPEPSAVNIAMLHTSLAGAPGHDVYAPCALSELAQAGFDYWALGHVHKRKVHSQAPLVVMPGTPQGRDIGEDGPKSATLLTIDGNSIAIGEVHTSAVEFRRCELDIAAAADESALTALIGERLREEVRATRSGLAILRLRFVGAGRFAWRLRRDLDVWRETCAEAARATGRLHLESLALDLDEGGGRPAASDAVGELQAMMLEIAGEEGFLEAARAELAQALSHLPKDRREALAPDEAAEARLLARLAHDGALATAARMRGAAGEDKGEDKGEGEQ